MAAFHFSRSAEADLLIIGAYTIRMWGEAQADRYMSDLEACCQRLADQPALGRQCEDIRPGLRRMEQGKHVVFYRQQVDGNILVTRILHARMLPERHAMDDEGGES